VLKKNQNAESRVHAIALTMWFGVPEPPPQKKPASGQYRWMLSCGKRFRSRSDKRELHEPVLSHAPRTPTGISTGTAWIPRLQPHRSLCSAKQFYVSISGVYNLPDGKVRTIFLRTPDDTLIEVIHYRW